MLQSTGSNGYSTDSKLTRLRYGTKFESFLVPQRRGYSVDHLLEINYTDQMWVRQIAPFRGFWSTEEEVLF